MENKINKLSNLDFTEFKKKISEENVKNLLEYKSYLDDIYYNSGEFAMKDEYYDYIKDTLEKDHNYKPTIGAKLREGKNRVDLPIWLGSMDKIKPEDIKELSKWIFLNSENKVKYLISDKLDGVSALLIVKNGEYNLYTRGDGIVGADISSIIPYINYIPKNLKNITVRGELVITIKTFNNYYKGDKDTENKGVYANARNMVSGLVNSKTARQGLVDLDFVVYENIVEERNISPSKQLSFLKESGFRVVRYKILQNLTVDNLIETLIEFKNKSPYEIDGIIVQADKPYIRNVDGNPKYAFAFKMMLGDNIAETVVEEVIWNISMRGMLKPRVKIDPIKLSGVTITYATGFNGKFIEDNKIGPGAVIQVTRSGDVIPYIVSVVSPSDEAQLPDIPYYWNETHVDLFAEEGGRTMCIKILNNFFTTLGVKHVSLQTYSKLYDNGADNLIKLLKLKKTDLMKIEGVQEKMAEKIYTNIHDALKNVPLYKLMAASSIFGLGMGVKKMKLLTEAFPSIMTEYKNMSRQELYDNIINIEGYSDITVNKIIANLPWFDRFLKDTKKFVTLLEKKNIEKQDLTGVKVVFSGVRNKKLEEKIESRGGSVATSVSSKTTVVITNDKEQTTGKIQKAKNLNIPIFTIEQFEEKYFS
jgi:NAD-dependent DNA ligase